MKRTIKKTTLLLSLVTLFAVFFVPSTELKAQKNQNSKKAERPNILWLFQEDLSPWLGCYGYEIQKGQTPTIDAMAASGVRFSRAFVPAPVCSICRSAIITGANQIRFGAHEHRSRRGKAELPLPEGMKTTPELMTEQGYFCFNVGKSDYNFEHSTVYQTIEKSNNKTPWRARKPDQPFFGQIQLKGGKINTKNFANKTDRAAVTIPADYPQNDLYREVVAEHFDSARMDDQSIDQILKRLDADGLTASTIVVYFSDHGANNLVRHKQQPTEGGSHVPFIISGPEPWVPAPSVRDDLVSMLDLSATTLAWAGVAQPKWMEGQNLFGVKLVPREFVATARDRCDHTIDRIRSIRTDRFRFTRNYMLDRVLLQPQYRDRQEYVKQLRDSYADGTLEPHLAEIYFGERPAEELYDVVNDPAQINNLINDPKYGKEAARHRKLLDGWIAKGDTGEGSEPEIELEMASNKKWGSGVNAEYETIRKDSDGDGLSDEWENFNDRNPTDGKLEFQFNCGGWQTEGWTGDNNVTNIAGKQGQLEFEMLNPKASLKRKGLNLSPDKNTNGLAILLKCSQPITMEFMVNGQSLMILDLPTTEEFTEYDLHDGSLGKKAINRLELVFESPAGTVIEIDKIEAK